MVLLLIVHVGCARVRVNKETHPHVHVLADGCFYGKGIFRVAPAFKLKDLEKLFRLKVLAMLLGKKKITRELIRMLDGWRHSGFNVFAGERTCLCVARRQAQPREKRSLENLAAYLIWATFSQERMEYLPEQATVVYHSKDRKEQKTYDALKWLAAFGLSCPGKRKADNPLRWRLRQLGQGQTAQAATSRADPHRAGARNLFRSLQA